jgi:hypothetical protein
MNMKPSERKEFLPHGIQVEVHRESGYAKGFISEVCNGKASPTDEARKVAVRIARKAKRPVRELFPEYYGSAA